MMRLSDAARWRWQVGTRTLIAIFAAYALAALASARLAAVCALFMPRSDAALTGMLLSFVFYAVAILWTFGAATLRRACSGLLLAGGLLLMIPH